MTTMGDAIAKARGQVAELRKRAKTDPAAALVVQRVDEAQAQFDARVEALYFSMASEGAGGLRDLL